MSDRVRRREFLTWMIMIAASCPVASPAQQNLPLIGFFSSRSEAESEQHLRAFRDGLREAGYVEGQNVAFEYRWARGRYGGWAATTCAAQPTTSA
jgi:putative ABC transport system substrate-binding protein